MRAIYHHSAIAARPGKATPREDGLCDFIADNGFTAEAVTLTDTPQHECLYPEPVAVEVGTDQSEIERLTLALAEAEAALVAVLPSAATALATELKALLLSASGANKAKLEEVIASALVVIEDRLPPPAEPTS